MHRIEKKTEKRMKENCGKIENILNLALDATREEREKSLNLDVGYDVADDSWEVIVKFFPFFSLFYFGLVYAKGMDSCIE